jgi:hypothetical protein
MGPLLRAHSEAKGEAIQRQHLDCFVALLLAMTRALGQFRRNPRFSATRGNVGSGVRFLQQSLLF